MVLMLTGSRRPAWRPPGAPAIASIARIQLQGLEKRLAQMEMTLSISDAALAKIAEAGFDPIYGARPLKRAIPSELENPLAKEILSGRFAPKDTIRVDVHAGGFRFEKGTDGVA